MTYKVFIFLLISLFVVSCSRTPYWRVVSKDCYEQIKIDYISDSSFFQEIESVFPIYIQSHDLVNQEIAFEQIDSVIRDAHTASVLKKFFLRRNIYKVFVSKNNKVSFACKDFCNSKTHPYDAIILTYLTFSYKKELELNGKNSDCNDSVYCIGYSLSANWNFVTIVNQ